MRTAEPTDTLGDLVVKDPRRARLFEQLRLEYCCGGQRTLEEACAQRGLDPETVVAVLNGLHEDATAASAHGYDVGRASITELCDHIVQAHHDRLREELPHTSDLLSTVVRVHGEGRPELHDLRRLFAGMRLDLEGHLEIEEQTLFPACRALSSAHGADGFDEALLVLHEAEHEAVGDALAALRELTGGYRTEHALCATHRALLQSLREIEADLHQHVHEENNVLFPRVRERLRALAVDVAGGRRIRAGPRSGPTDVLRWPDGRPGARWPI
ncbi:MAG: regulator of cell morphosis and signaling [Solirubrobacteraceae bacterium]|nr:regulator of cell morphosis and signaling [Solirubrobacteraceae bacterium]